MNWLALVAGFGVGIVAGSPIGWLIALFILWRAARQQATSGSPAAPTTAGLRLVDDGNVS